MKEKKSFSNLREIIFEDFQTPPWPCYVKPKEDELLTSWLTRLARNHLLRFYSFCSSYFYDSNFWNRDIDKTIPQKMRVTITAKSPLANEDINEMMLSSYVGSLFTSMGESRSTWIIPLNLYSIRRKHRTGLSVCPRCLKKDGKNPYYRKRWRLSTSVVCDKCGIYLIDRCPNCKAEINYLHSERGKKLQAPLFPISRCWKCLFELSSAKSLNASSTLKKLQVTINEYIDKGYAFDRDLSYSHLYFDVLRKIITLLNRSQKSQIAQLQKLINKYTRYHYFKSMNNRQNSFDSMGVKQRSELLLKAFWLLNGWPIRFRTLTKKAGLRSKMLLDDFRDCPYWFYKEVSENNRVVHASWRKDYPQYSYSSFSELASYKASKIKNYSK